MKRLLMAQLSALALGALTACGGGNGTSATLASFSSWSAVSRNSSITVEGISQAGTYEYDIGTDRLTSVSLGDSSTGASYTATYDANGQATATTLSPAGQTPISFNSNTDTLGPLIINQSIDAAVSADGTKYGLAANPFDFGWSYQSFGTWATGAGTGSGTYGSISVGAATPGASIPTTGTATYGGYSAGRYVNGSGEYWFISSSMTAAANFGSRNIAFTTTGTQVTSNLTASSTNSNLDMTGMLSYTAATNQITGNVTTTGGLSGTVNGRFYGPAAQEIGGTFAVTSGGLEGYAGAFGGKR